MSLALCRNLALAQVLDAPDFNCIQVAANGDATLNWNPPADPGSNFTHYEIYTSLYPGIPFTSVASVAPLAQNTYTQSTTVTFNNDYYYFIQAWSTDGSTNYVSQNSDTLRNIFLEAIPAGNNCQNCDSSAYLNWNSPFFNEANAPAGLSYEVWTDYPGNSWHLIQTLPYGVSNWLYIVENCNPDTMNFQIKMMLPNGCEFVSNIDGDNFSDNTHPNTAIITSVSVDIANHGVIEWESSTSPDTDGYWVYKCNGTGTTLMDYVTGINNVSYTDVFAQPYLGPLNYAIAAVDFCGNTDTTICSSSVFLDVEAFIPCDEGIFMDWSPYTSWPDPTSYYIIYRAFSTDANYSNDPFLPIDTVLGSSLILSYVDLNIQYGGYNVYQIEAVDTIQDFHAKSNFVATLVPSYDPPSFVYLSEATVISQDSVQVLLEMQPTLLSFQYTLERYDESAQNWDDVISLNGVNQNALTFYDSQVSTDVFSYQYRVVVMNSCGVFVDTSNVGTTILTGGISDQNRLTNTVVWSPYSEWQNGVDFYRIHRRIGKDGPFDVIAQIDPGANLNYEDDVSDLTATEGEFCYKVEGVELSSDVLGTSHSSFSNILCLSLKPVIWVPNCFMVEGHNRLFSPVISFADFDNYHMLIYSRWGDVIFDTHDFSQAWDGTMNGKTVQEGTYTYFMSVRDGKGKQYEKSGYVTMLVNKEK